MERNLRNDDKREKTSKFHSIASTIRPQIDQQSLKTKKIPKTPNEPCNLGPNETRRNSNEEGNNHSNNAMRQYKTTKRMQRSNHKVDRTDKNRKLTREA